MKEEKNVPLLYECILEEFEVECEEILWEILKTTPNDYPTFLIFMKLSSNSIEGPKPPSHFYDHKRMGLELRIISSVEMKNTRNENKFMGSIIDIGPNLLQYMGFKIPYTYVGKRRNMLSKSKFKKHSPGYRERILCEYPDGSKSLITEKYQFNLKLGEEKGEIYDIKKDPQCKNNLWGKEDFKEIQTQLSLQFLWAQLDKQVMPMPRIAGA